MLLLNSISPLKNEVLPGERLSNHLFHHRNEGSGNLLVLRDILITYAAFHPGTYAQGMNDLCSRFLEVLDSEVDTYWSFSCYMDKVGSCFTKRAGSSATLPSGHRQHGKIHFLPQVGFDCLFLLFLSLYKSFSCLPFRWLLLGFQREFEHSDALRLFEIFSCDHLELISQQVDRARYQERLLIQFTSRCVCVVWTG
uniref:Rab-GAP TBC domain-containing protein n=1 Tax=Sinocyclocheilus grahami TaxID=75366 RepID=A0A672LLF2_SINGR